MKLNISISCAMLLLLTPTGVALAQKSIRKHTPSGYVYNIVRPGKGKHPVEGQYVVANLRLFTKDTVWLDTRKTPLKKSIVAVGPASERRDPLMEMLPQLVTGDSAVLNAPAKLIFSQIFQQPMPAELDPETIFYFSIGVTSIINQEQFDKISSDYKNAFDEKVKNEGDAQFQKDVELIGAYLKKNNLEAIELPSGVRYIIKDAGTGGPARQGQKIKFNYTGWHLDGTCFDTSIEAVARAKNIYKPSNNYKPLVIETGVPQLILGIDEVLPLMNNKADYVVYIPSGLAYGSAGIANKIQPNEILIFEILIAEIW